MAHDLRSALDLLDAAGDLETVARPVDRAWEVTAVLDRLERDGRFPAVRYDAVEGFPGWAIAGNLFATRSKIAAFLGCAPDQVPAGQMVQRLELAEASPARYILAPQGVQAVEAAAQAAKAAVAQRFRNLSPRHGQKF